MIDSENVNTSKDMRQQLNLDKINELWAPQNVSIFERATTTATTIF